MEFNDCLLEAVDRVLTWGLSDEAIPQALATEASHLAALDSEQLYGDVD